MLANRTALLAIEWDPDITGYLAVGIGVLVLCGSVYLLLATNVGSRLGFLIAWTGLWAWMMLMGGIWWVFAIGYIGNLPSWEILAITPDLTTSVVEDVRDLGDLQPDEEVPEGWEEVPADARGDAEASADAVVPEFLGVTGSLDYEKHRVLETGGERQLPLGIPSNVITDFFIPSRGDPHYAVVQVQAYEPAEPVDLNSDEVPEREVDSSQPVFNVIMERDQGNRRFPPALFTIVSAAAFGIGAWLLHRRDKTLDAIQAETTGS
jgi:hypothetical protein